MQNGDVYEGTWVNNKLEGPGKITYKDHGDQVQFFGLGAFTRMSNVSNKFFSSMKSNYSNTSSPLKSGTPPRRLGTPKNRKGTPRTPRNINRFRTDQIDF